MGVAGRITVGWNEGPRRVAASSSWPLPARFLTTLDRFVQRAKKLSLTTHGQFWQSRLMEHQRYRPCVVPHSLLDSDHDCCPTDCRRSRKFAERRGDRNADQRTPDGGGARRRAGAADFRGQRRRCAVLSRRLRRGGQGLCGGAGRFCRRRRRTTEEAAE